MERKNPYAELARYLRALPEDARELISGYLYTTVGDDDRFCGCAFGMAYPRRDDLVDLPNNPRTAVDPESRRAFSGRSREAVLRFDAWVREIGGDVAFVEEVISMNDTFKGEDFLPEIRRARYAHVLAKLDAAAEFFDQGGAT